MTLIVLPLAMLINYVMYVVQVQMFHSQGLKVRRNFLGFLVYAFLYGAILQPACLVGYWMELLRVQKVGEQNEAINFWYFYRVSFCF